MRWGAIECVRVCKIAGLLLSFALQAATQTGASKVGIINIQQAISSTKDGQRASQQLESKYQPKQKEFEKRQADLAGLEQQLQKGNTLLSEEKRMSMARELEQKRKALERDTSDARDEFGSEEQKLVEGFGQKMLPLIKKYAEDHGYSLILDASSPQVPILYAAPTIDITADIITAYDNASRAAPRPGASSK
jgi:outer membrane protein